MRPLRLNRRTGRPRISEHVIQAGVVSWAHMQMRVVPLLRLLHAIPNGAATRRKLKATPAGTIVSYSPEGKKLKREGLTKGIPDMNWPVPRGGYLGLYIEHKADGGAVDDEQWEMIDLLREQGHCVVISFNTQTSIDVLRWYYGLGSGLPRSAPLAPCPPEWRTATTPPPDPPRRIHRADSKAGKLAAARKAASRMA